MKKLLDWITAFPDWLRAGRNDYQYYHRRRLTARYLAKKRKVKTLWIVAGAIMLLNPQLSFVVVVGLITTFLSLGILDDTD